MMLVVDRVRILADLCDLIAIRSITGDEELLHGRGSLPVTSNIQRCFEYRNRIVNATETDADRRVRARVLGGVRTLDTFRTWREGGSPEPRSAD